MHSRVGVYVPTFVSLSEFQLSSLTMYVQEGGVYREGGRERGWRGGREGEGMERVKEGER